MTITGFGVWSPATFPYNKGLSRQLTAFRQKAAALLAFAWPEIRAGDDAVAVAIDHLDPCIRVA